MLNSNSDKQDDSENSLSYNLPEDGKSCFKFKSVTENNVNILKAISRIKNECTFGLDKIPSFFLKKQSQWNQGLWETYLIFQSKGKFPNAMKCAREAPIVNVDPQ